MFLHLQLFTTTIVTTGVALLEDGKSTTDMGEAVALLHAMDIVDVYSNSRGPSDSGYTVKGPGNMTKQALEIGVNNVRKMTVHHV